MIIIEPTKYTKRLLGRSWLNCPSGRWTIDRSENAQKLFFRMISNNRIAYAHLGDDWYSYIHKEDSGYRRGGRFYATEKKLIVGIGRNFSEAKENGKMVESSFSNYKYTEVNDENLETLRSRAIGYTI